MIDNKPLPDSDKYCRHDEGNTHTLTISDLTSEDNYDVTANFGDVSTTAKLVVEGNIFYCLFYCNGSFRENFIFTNSVKRHTCDSKNLRLGHDLPISVSDRLISPFHEGLIFTKFRICEVSRKLNPRENF